MNNVKLQKVRIGETEGGIACGPVGGDQLVEVEYLYLDGRTEYLTFANVGGMINFYRAPISIYDIMMDAGDDENAEDEEDSGDDENNGEDADDEEEADDGIFAEIDEKYRLNFGDYGEYDELFENWEDEWQDLYRYVIWIANCEDPKEYIAETEGKWLDEIEIPVTEYEEEYNDAMDIEPEKIDSVMDVELTYYIVVEHPYFATDPEPWTTGATKEEAAAIERARAEGRRLADAPELKGLLERAEREIIYEEADNLSDMGGLSRLDVIRGFDGFYRLEIAFTEDREREEK